MLGAQESIDVYTKQQRIAQLGQRYPERGFTSLAHHIDLEWMNEAYRRTRKDGAAGVDGVTAAHYEQDLEANLLSLLERAKSGTYRAPPVRRVFIPKGGGGRRPIGIPTLEDKVLQRAVVMLLEPLYEQDFLDVSYGFRPRRSAHQALEAVRSRLTDMGGGWVVDLDIQAFFDTLDRRVLRAMVEQRVQDGVLRRLIGKWLSAGVLEDGCVYRAKLGTPQGGVISPLLANLYLHEVLDRWFVGEVQSRLRGRSFLVRYADDAVMGFSCEVDARRMLELLAKRFAKFGLRLHPEKTRLLYFRPPRTGTPPAQTLDLLGFTHYWAKSRRGRWVIKRKTAKDRFRRALRAAAQWCRRVRHLPLVEQHQRLVRKLKGHYAYYGISGNLQALRTFCFRVTRVWIKWLGRRSQRARLSWEQARKLLMRFPLPPARIVHSYRSSVVKL